MLQKYFVFEKTGTGIERLLPHCNRDCIDLIKKMLVYDSEERINAYQALNHEYFRDMVEKEQNLLLQTSLQSIKMLKTPNPNDSILEKEKEKLKKYESLNQHKKIFGLITQTYLPSLK